MGIKKIRFYNFRNLENKVIDLTSPVVMLVGKNGQGKSNFIEAIYYICYGSSFRANNDKYVIKKDTSECLIQGEFHDEFEIPKKIDIKMFKNKKKEICENNKLIKDRKKLLENTPCIIFSYEDIIFVNGPPEKKRWFFDQTLCLFDILYVDLFRNFKKILKSRNILLKQNKKDLIDIYDIKLVELGWEIQNKRIELIKDFNKVLIPLFAEIFSKEIVLKIEYRPSWSGFSKKSDILDNLKKNRFREFQYGTTLSGPHRDSFKFLFNNHEFANFGSTGQIRLVSLILRIAQANFFLLKTGKKPILLFDDVLLEMDSIKRKKALKFLPEYEQLFFTFLPNENFTDYGFNNKLIYEIVNGKVKEWNGQEKY